MSNRATHSNLLARLAGLKGPASGSGLLALLAGPGSPRPHRPWPRYLLSVALVAGATLLGMPIPASISPTTLVILYLAVVVVAGAYLGRGPSILAAILSVLALDFFFVPPHLTFAIAQAEYALIFAGLFIVGVVISTLTAHVREQADEAQRRQAETAELYGFSRDLATAIGMDQILEAIAIHVGRIFQRQAVVFLQEESGLQPRALGPGPGPDQADLALATWALQHGEPAGREGATSAAAPLCCLPLRTARGVVGVLGVKAREPLAPLTLERWRLLEAFADQAALALERAYLAQQAQEASLLQATERFQTALLSSISHDLRTPLVAITGALSSLRGGGLELEAPVRHDLIENAYDEALRLNHLVGNLLDITRLEAGTVRISKEPGDIQDLIGIALDRLRDRLGDHPVNVDVAPHLPLVPMDSVLIVQVLVNLLDNAVKYSPPGEPIDVSARVSGDDLEVQVADRGIGLPPGDLGRVFDKFYRVGRQDGVTGTGLGLAICKGFVEVHGGQVRATNRLGGGTVVTFTLPLH